MNQTECSHFWEKADYMPMEAILDYWCEGKPYECREAKKQAILAACDNREILYTRSDGKSWDDSVYDLCARNILLIKRESFGAWVGLFDGHGDPTPPRIHIRTEETLLKIIGALMLANYQGKEAYMYGGKLNVSQVAKNILTALPDGVSLSERTITDKISQAMKTVPDNRPSWA